MFAINVAENNPKVERNYPFDSSMIRTTSSSEEKTGHVGLSIFRNMINLNLEDLSWTTGLFGVGIVIGMSCLTLIVTCFPQHNVVFYPEYWYEPIILMLFLSACPSA